MLRTGALVALGGGLGALGRVLLGEGLGDGPAVLVVNLLGALLLGVADARWRGRRPLLLALAGTGALGGFTTVSAWAALMAGSWSWFWAGPLLLAAGVVLALLGLRLGGCRPDGERRAC